MTSRTTCRRDNCRGRKLKASHKKHRPHIKVGKDAEEEEEVSCTCKNNRSNI